MNSIKACIAVLVSALIVFSLIVPFAAAEAPIIGDVDGDKSVTLVDATILQYGLAHMHQSLSEYAVVGDTDADGVITITDVTMIQRYEAKIITQLPYLPYSPTESPTDADGWGYIIYRP